MKETVLEKLKVLAESAKYDVSCASSGVTRRHRAGGVGSTAGWGRNRCRTVGNCFVYGMLLF